MSGTIDCQFNGKEPGGLIEVYWSNLSGHRGVEIKRKVALRVMLLTVMA